MSAPNYPTMANPHLQQVSNMHKYPSMASMASTTVPLPPGYVPRAKPKRQKPFGPSFRYMMNRTYMGPGKRKMKYALVCLIIAMVWFGAGAVYLGLRNVSRMIVYNTEVLGPLCVGFGIIFVGLAAKFISEARMESNEWRKHIRFRPSGLRSIVAVNMAFVPDEGDKLQTGTYGDRALTEMPKGRGRPPRSRRPSGSTLGRSMDRSLDDTFDSKPPLTLGLPDRLPRRPPPGGDAYDDRFPPPQYDVHYPPGVGPGLPPAGVHGRMPPPGMHGRMPHPGMQHGGPPPPGMHGMPPGMHRMPPPGMQGMPHPGLQGRPGFQPPQPPGARRYQSPMREMQPIRDPQPGPQTHSWGRQQPKVQLGGSQEGVSESEL